MDRKKREELLHQIQRLLADRVSTVLMILTMTLSAGADGLQRLYVLDCGATSARTSRAGRRGSTRASRSSSPTTAI
jgi:hypothetical protein